MMERPDATAHFRGPERLNCAQAILRAFANVADVDAECVQRFSQFGSGHAPGGECGALFAAKTLLEDEAAQQRVEAAFVSAAGSAACRQIRSLGRLTCRQCVATASDRVYEQAQAGQRLRRPAADAD